jgi:hypothetical protein
MRRVKAAGVVLLSLIPLSAGCAAHTDYMISYRSVPPFHPADPNELLAELTVNLPPDIEVRHFLYHRRENEMRGIVVVRGDRARDTVWEALRGNPRLGRAGSGPEKADTARKSLICFCSVPPFAPRDPDALLAELKQGLPPGIEPRMVRSRRRDEYMVLWITVRGNFGKEVVKFALRQNPKLELLQVEDAPLFLGP